MNNSYRGWPDPRVYKKNNLKKIRTISNRYLFDDSNQKFSSTPLIEEYIHP